MGRRHRRRQFAAVRRALRLRRPARRVHGLQGRVQALDARPAGRRVRGFAGQAGVPADAADARAAHSPREGDVQHLHGAGAARRDGEHVRRLSRTGRPDPYRATHSPAHRHLRRRAEARRPEGQRNVLRHARGGRCRRGCRARRGAGTRHQPARVQRARRRRTRVADRRRRVRRDHDPCRRRNAVGRLRRAGECRRTRRRRRGRRDGDPDGAASHDPLPDPSRIQYPSQRARDAALPALARRQGPRARPHDDSAGLVHDEAQRDERDDSCHLAGVRQHPPARAGRPVRGLPAADRRTRTDARRVHGLRRGQPAAQLRRAGRVRRLAGDPCLSPRARRGPSDGLPDSRERARHEPGVRPDVRHGRGRGEDRPRWQRRHRRPEGESRTERQRSWRR